MPEEKTDKLPEDGKKLDASKPWSKKHRHHGTFTTFRGKAMPAYMEFQEVEGKDRGFAIYCAKTNKEFKPGVRILEPRHIKIARLKFELSGRMDPVAKKGEKDEE